MGIETFFNASKKTLKENAPAVLSALGVGGVVTTAILAYNQGVNHGIDRELDERMNLAPLTGKEKFERYIVGMGPVFLSGALAATCIISAAAINNRRQAALVGLVSVGEATLREYKDKVREVVTKPKQEQIATELAQKQLDSAPVGDVIVVGDGDILVFDTLTGRVFKSSQLAVEKAEVEINRRLLSEMYVSQNEWYAELKLPRVAMGDDLGWNNERPLDVNFVALIHEGKPVLGIDYRFRPFVGFSQFG